MNLPEQDADLFYELMWALQCFIGQKTGLLDGQSTPEHVEGLPQEDKINLREAVYDNIPLILEYVRENPYQQDEAALKLVGEWVNFARGDFYIERYLKNFAIFIGGKQVYAVRALYDPFDEIIHKSHLPLLVSAVLLPFKGQIVFDGLLFSRNVYFGSNMRASLKEEYMRAKQNGRIIDNLPPSIDLPAKKTAKTKSKNWSKEIKQLQKASQALKGGAGQPALNSPAFSLVKNSIELANQTALESADAQTLSATLRKIKRSVTQIENILYRMED